ncbi:hypothetical protein [Halorussus halobius]|uniref:hypothetical protein n=1 Tax=Halorussus halobius TaxID=1710537 RepID=UPI0010924697|nr:hypothetical protein [Halorussus halobius]
MSTESPTSDVPREPSAYRPTNHFRDRFRDATDSPPRHLDGEIVRECITRGEVARRDASTVGFRREFSGVAYVIVVNPESGTCVTGHPVALDWQTASGSDRWTREQLHDIDEFLRAKYRD